VPLIAAPAGLKHASRIPLSGFLGGNEIMTRTIIGTAALIGSLAFGATALAADYGSSGTADATSAAAKADMMDTNKDGKISAEEHAAGAKSMFTAMDTNGDGKVTAVEMDAYHAMKKDTWDKDSHRMSSAEKIKMIDTDGDGAISAAEHDAASQSMFSKMDTDHDGNLTATEMKAGHKRMLSDASSATKSTTPSTTTTETETKTTTQTQ